MYRKQPPSDFAIIRPFDLKLNLATKIFVDRLWRLDENRSVELRVDEYQQQHLFCYQSTESNKGGWSKRTFYAFHVDEITNDNFEQIYKDFWKMIEFFRPNTRYGIVLIYKKFLCDDVSLKYFCKQLPRCESWGDVYQIDELKQLDLIIPTGYTLK